VRRVLPVLAAALAAFAAGCGSSGHKSATTTTTATASATEQSVCPSEQKAGIDALFGIRRSQAAAQELMSRAGQVGFRGLLVQRRGCNRFAVVLEGLRSRSQASAFQHEAAGSGFPVQIECRSHPVEGGLAAVFGHTSTPRAAQKLLTHAEAAGFRGLRVQEDSCGNWEVDLYGLNTPAQRHELAAEARKAGLHVVFELG
jgi:cell division septation protein DedD